MAPSSQPAAADPEADRPPLLTRVQVLCLVAAVVVCRLLAIRAFPIYDDAFITYRYARNLARGLGMVFNPGAEWEPVMGTTTPGFCVLLAGLHKLGLPMIPAAVGVDVLMDGLSALLIIQLLERRLVAATIAVLAFATTPELARISAGGMEPPVLVAAALLATWCLQQQRFTCAGIAAAIACTIRPEAVLLVGLLVLWIGWRRAALVRFLLPIAVIGALTVGLLTAVYGTPIAHSITAKSEHHRAAESTLWRVPLILRQAFAPSVPMVLLLPVMLLGAVRSVRKSSRFLPFALFGMAIIGSYLLARPKTWGWYYYTPLVAWAGWIGLGFEGLCERLGVHHAGLGARGWGRGLAAAAPLLAILGVSLYPLVRADRVTTEIYDNMQAWAEQERLVERGATVLASDIGAISWYTDAFVYDSEGLTWPGALPYSQSQPLLAIEFQPDYVVLVGRRERVAAWRSNHAASDAYRPVVRFSRNPVKSAELEPHLDELPQSWAQDYIVLERVDASRPLRE